MKTMKPIAVLLFALFLSVGLLACGAEETDGVANPVTEVSTLEELRKTADCAMIAPETEGLSEEHYSLIEGETPIAEYGFTVDGTECFLRFAKTDITMDISGIHGEDGTLFADTENETLYIENDQLKAQRWVTVDGQYIFAAMDGGQWDWTVFDGLCKQFMDMEPKNWTAEVPFAVYQALEGDYQNEAGDVYGSITIKGDHVGLYVLVSQEDNSRLYWEMEAVLEEDRLVYEKETISQIVYDETSGQTVTTALEDGGAGSVAVEDGTLTFDDTTSPQLKDLILTAVAR